MTILYRLRALVRWLFRRDEIEHALASDLEDYIERSAAEKMQAGMSESEARRAARIELGGVEQAKERVRVTLSLGPVEKLVADAGYALRELRRQKTFTIVVVLTLALGVGVNVAIFSLFQQILLRPLPVPEPSALINLSDPGPDLGGRSSNQTGGLDSIFSYPMFRDLEREQEPFVGIAGHRIFDANLSSDAQARRGTGVLVSGSYFPVLGLEPEVGRLLGPQDDRVDGLAESVVLSYAYWRSEFGADEDVIGDTMSVNGMPLTIVGVAPRGFHGTTSGMRASVFVPISIRWSDLPGSIPNHGRRDYYWIYLFARLAPGIGIDRAAVSVNSLYRSLLSEIEAPLRLDADEEVLEEFRTKSLVFEPGSRGQGNFTSLRGRLNLLFAASALVLTLCCANIAGLMLVRGAARTGEMAVRASLGASRGRLVSMSLTESLLLALPAAVISLPIGLLTLRGIASGTPGIPAAAFDVDLGVGAAVVGISAALVSAVAFGLAPALRLMRSEPARALQSYGVRQTSTKNVTRFRTSLATAQIALSMALLAMAGALSQSLANIARIDLGFAAESVVTFSISPELSGYSPEASAMLFARLEDELAAIAGVRAASSSMISLLSGRVFGTSAAVGNSDGGTRGMVSLNHVSPAFFRALQMRLLAGREFRESDDPGAPQVAIVNQRFVELFGLGGNVIGQQIAVGGTIGVEVVGLVADAKYEGIRREIEPQVFRPRRQFATLGSASFYVRGEHPSAALLSAIRETATRIDPVVPITGLRTMNEQVRANLVMERYAAGTATAFALLATVLAGLGMFGVLAYHVAQRSREIGLRLALGAPLSRIYRMLLRKVLVMASSGIVAGIGITWLLGRAARSVLYGVEASSPLVLAGAATVLGIVMVGAVYVPARRASRVDPVNVLRYE